MVVCNGVFALEMVMPGWACCRCHVYNGLQRVACRSCGEFRHDFEIPDTVKLCACGFGYRPSMGENLKDCPVCGEGLVAAEVSA